MTVHDDVGRRVRIAGALALLLAVGLAAIPPARAADAGRDDQGGAAPQFHDSHFHLTNYIQEGIDVRRFLEIMGTRVGRSTLFGIPVQQQWSYANSADYAPTYYLHSDAPLYYYSFTDAYIASVYRALPKDQQARLDPMITGFNPADMYGVEHIKRVLRTFPGVFSGIGEFSIHKEFVSSKIAGETASLINPALDRILDFAGEAGLAVILHNDIDMPFAKADAEPVYLAQSKALFRRHPKTTIIWAHTGLGRVVHPAEVTANAAERSPAPRGNPGGHVDRPGSQSPELRYLVGRGGQVRGVVSRSCRARRRPAQQVPGPLPVRHRHRGPGRPGSVLRGVRDVGAGVPAAHAGDQPQGAAGKLRASLR